MKRFTLLLAVPGLVLVIGLAVATISTYLNQGQVYSVTEVEGHLAGSPGEWAGRTVRVHALVGGCGAPGGLGPPVCRPVDLLDPAAPATADPLPLAWGGPEPVSALLRRMPLLRRFAPQPQMMQWGVAATYRVQFRVRPSRYCGTGTCYEALLLDAAPNSPQEQPSMKRYAGLVIALVGLVLPIGLVVAIAADSQVTRGPVYSVAQVQAGLADQPQAWVERTVLVRAVAEACIASRGAPLVLSCSSWPADLLEPGPMRAQAALPLAWGSEPPLQVFLRRLPLARRLVPSQAVHWDAVATYRVQVRAVPVDACTSLPWLPTPNSVLDQTHCPGYEAVLVDAAPGSP